MTMIRVLVNASSCAVGGSVQVSLGFIREAMAQACVREWVLIFAVAPAVAKVLESDIMAAGWRLEVFEIGPGRLLHGFATRRRLHSLCIECKADVVFTVFGPSYVRFPVPELMGFAEPFAITPYRGCYANHSLLEALLAWIKGNSKRLFLHSAQRFWVETESAKMGLCSRAFINPSLVDVVPNGVNAAFASSLRGGGMMATRDILLLGAGYPHKNHNIIIRCAMYLMRIMPDSAWRFVVTLPTDAAVWTSLWERMTFLGMSHRVVNIGVLNLSQCATAYEAASVIFHPSLVEIFSATYLEAMAARRPLVVSDRPFAHEICGDAALYFDPLDAQAAAEAIARVLTDSNVCEQLVASGVERLKQFPDAAEKNGRLCGLIDAFARIYVR